MEDPTNNGWCRGWHFAFGAVALLAFVDAVMYARHGNPVTNLVDSPPTVPGTAGGLEFFGWMFLHVVAVTLFSILGARSLTIFAARFGKFCSRCGNEK